MANFYQRAFGFTNPQETRPSRDDYFGINTDSVQMVGLQGWWPTWETMANGQAAPQAMDYGPNVLNMVPSALTLHTPDTSHGTVWSGNYVIGITGISSGYAQSRPYAKGLIATQMDPVDFGALPNTGGPLATAYMSSAWIRTSQLALNYNSTDGPKDNYIYSFDRNDATGFPGHTLGTIQQTPNGVTATTQIAGACIFDNDVSASVPLGVQSLQTINDGQWHLITGLYYPVGNSGSTRGQGVQYITVDGQVGFIGGVDNYNLGGSQPFGASFTQVNLGSSKDATHTAVTPVSHFLGSDDDGVSSAFVGLIGDHRLYSYGWAIGAGPQDIISIFLQQSAHMYAPETRWELYRPRSGQRPSLSLSSSVILPTAAVWLLRA